MPVSKKVSISCNYPIKALCKKEKQVPLVRGKFWYFSFFFFFFLVKLMKTKERKPCSQGLSPYVLEEERPWKQQQRQNCCHFLDQSGKSPKPRDSPSVFFPRCTYLRLAYCSFLASYGVISLMTNPKTSCSTKKWYDAVFLSHSKMSEITSNLIILHKPFVEH